MTSRLVVTVAPADDGRWRWVVRPDGPIAVQNLAKTGTSVDEYAAWCAVSTAVSHVVADLAVAAAERDGR